MPQHLRHHRQDHIQNTKQGDEIASRAIIILLPQRLRKEIHQGIQTYDAQDKPQESKSQESNTIQLSISRHIQSHPEQVIH